MNIHIRAYSKKELANMYQVTRRVFWQWCISAGLYDRHTGFKRMIIVPPAIVQDIFTEFGEPEKAAPEYRKGPI